MDANHLIWSAKYAGDSYDRAEEVWSDGSDIYVTGDTGSYGGSYANLFLVRWDQNGNQVWNRTWGGGGCDEGYAVCGNSTHIFTCGRTESYGPIRYNLVLIKWDLEGNQIWYKVWGTAEIDQGLGVWANGSYVYTVGYSVEYGGSTFTFLLMKWDWQGNIVWTRTMSGYGADIWCDGSYLYTIGSKFIKWDAEGNQVWSQSRSGGTIWGDGVYLYTGGDSLLSKWDKDGNEIWSRAHKTADIWGAGDYIYTCFWKTDMKLYKWSTGGDLRKMWSYDLQDNDQPNAVWASGTEAYFAGFCRAWSGHDDAFLIKWDMDIYPHFEIDANETRIIATQSVLFEIEGDVGDIPMEAQWDFGDTTESTSETNILHVFETAGKYSAILTIVDLDGDKNASTLDYAIEVFGLDEDTDKDGLRNSDEIYKYNTDPFNSDTDGDGFSDGEEVRWGSDPNEYLDHPLLKLLPVVIISSVAVVVIGTAIIMWKCSPTHKTKKHQSRELPKESTNESDLIS